MKQLGFTPQSRLVTESPQKTSGLLRVIDYLNTASPHYPQLPNLENPGEDEDLLERSRLFLDTDVAPFVHPAAHKMGLLYLYTRSIPITPSENVEEAFRQYHANATAESNAAKMAWEVVQSGESAYYSTLSATTISQIALLIRRLGYFSYDEETATDEIIEKAEDELRNSPHAFLIEILASLNYGLTIVNNLQESWVQSMGYRNEGDSTAVTTGSTDTAEYSDDEE